MECNGSACWHFLIMIGQEKCGARLASMEGGSQARVLTDILQTVPWAIVPDRFEVYGSS